MLISCLLHYPQIQIFICLVLIYFRWRRNFCAFIYLTPLVACLIACSFGLKDHEQTYNKYQIRFL